MGLGAGLILQNIAALPPPRIADFTVNV